MPRPRRSVPQAQMSLFSQPQGSRRQNNRWIATATVTVEDLLKATERTAEELYGLETDYQRPLDRAHCAAIAKYYLDTNNWIIPPFVFTAQGENLTIEGGEFRNLESGLQILDGQHRVQALHIVHDTLRQAELSNSAEKLDNLVNSHVVLEFMENFGNQDAGQMFVDLNKSKRMSSSELAYLDGRDPVVNVIKETLAKVDWARERTDTIRSNPKADSSDIFTINNLKTIVKALEVGVKQSFPRARKVYMETPSGHEESAEKLQNFLNWLPTAREEFKNLTNNDTLNVPDEKTRHYAYDLRFIALIAETWSTSMQTEIPQEDLAATVANLNLFKNDAANHLKKDLMLTDDKDRLKAFSTGAYGNASYKIRSQVNKSNTG